MPLNGEALRLLNTPRQFVGSWWWYAENPDSNWILMVRSVEFDVTGRADTLIFEDFVPGGRGTQVYRFSLTMLRQPTSAFWFLTGGGGWFHVFVRPGQVIQEHDSGRVAQIQSFANPRGTQVVIAGSHRDGTNAEGRATYSGFETTISLYQLIRGWSPTPNSLTHAEETLEGLGPECPNCLLPMYYRPPTVQAHQVETCVCTPAMLRAHQIETAAEEVNRLSALWESAPEAEALPPAPPLPPNTSRFDRITEEDGNGN